MVFELSAVLIGIYLQPALQPALSCSVNGEPSHDELSFCGPDSTAFDKKGFDNLLGQISTAASKSKASAYNVTCQDEGMNFKELPQAEGSNASIEFNEPIQPVKGAVNIGVSKAADKNDPVINILGENNRVGRYDASNDQITWRNLPEDVKADKEAKFSEEGKYLEVPAKEAGVEPSRISLDDLFKKTESLVDLKPEQARTVISNPDEPANQAYKFVPGTNTADFKDLVVQNPDGALIRFPFEDSDSVPLQGIEKLGAGPQTYISSTAQLALTIETKAGTSSEARIWKGARLAETLVNRSELEHNSARADQSSVINKFVANQDGAKTESKDSSPSLQLGNVGLRAGGASGLDARLLSLMEKLLNPEGLDHGNNLVAAGDSSSLNREMDSLSTLILKTNQEVLKMGINVFNPLVSSGIQSTESSGDLELAGEDQALEAALLTDLLGETADHGFHIENGILIPDSRVQRAPSKSESSEIPLSDLNLLEWFLLPTRPKARRKLGSGQPA